MPIYHLFYIISRSKSSSLSRYFMMFLLIFDESTQVTKSSMLLLSLAVVHVFESACPTE